MATSQGMIAAFSTGSQAQYPPQPSTAYDHHAPATMPTPRRAHDTSAKRRVATSQRSPPSPRISEAIAYAKGTENRT